MKYSKLTGGFYATEIHGLSTPADALDISNEEHAALLAGQSQGKRIVADATGKPILQDPPAKTLAQVKAEKLAQLQAEKDRVMNLPVTSNGHVFARGSAGRAEITRRAFDSVRGVATPVTIRSDAGVPVVFSQPQLEMLYTAMAGADQFAIDRYWLKFDEVQAAAKVSVAAVEAVTW